MKYIVAFITSLICLPSFGQQLTYKEWQQESKSEIRLLPQYGNIKKTDWQLEADNKLIAEEVKQYGTRRKASEALVKTGFDYLYHGDTKTAMYRFNQAWLLDPKDENAFWGFAIVYFNFQDYNEALKQMEKGLLINPNSSNILTDKATIYMQYYHNSNNVSYLNKAIDIFKQSYSIDRSNQNTLFKLSVAYFYGKDCSNATRFYNECMKLGGQQISIGYGDELKKLCN